MLAVTVAVLWVSAVGFPNHSEQTERAFQDWLVRHGTLGMDGLELHTWTEGNGTYRTRGWRLLKDRPKRPETFGNLLLIPEKLVFSERTVLNELDLQFALDNAPQKNEGLVIAVGLMRALVDRDKSFWAEFVNVHRSDDFMHIPYNPLLPNDDTDTALAGLSPFYKAKVRAKRREILDIFRFAQAHLFPFMSRVKTMGKLEQRKMFVWAYMMYLSHSRREFHLGEVQDVILCGLNMFNHHSDARPHETILDAGQKRFWSVAVNNGAKAGEQIFANYDHGNGECSEEMYFRYGFVPTAHADVARDCYQFRLSLSDMPKRTFPLPGIGAECPSSKLRKKEHFGTLVTLNRNDDAVMKEIGSLSFYNGAAIECSHKALYDLLLAQSRRVQRLASRNGTRHVVQDIVRGQRRILRRYAGLVKTKLLPHVLW